MHVQARATLPALFTALSIDTAASPPWLFGHSDGASIALIHAASFPRRVAGVILAQFLPFADPAMLRLYGQFERGVYALLEAR